uniref:hypothetical protein n=1 Tax=Acetatifactor sp. TaxID=1872090 RepID=UPI004055E6AA
MEKKGFASKIGWKEESLAGKSVFLILLAVYTGVMFFLFWMQCNNQEVFVSDMPAYIDKVAGISGNYEFPYPLFFWVAGFFGMFCGAPTGTAIASTLLNSLGVCIAWYYLNREVKALTVCEKLQGRKRVVLDISICVMVFVLFLLGNLYSPKNTAFFGFDYAYRCMGIYTANPIWNATYMVTRPFAIIAFFEGAKLLGEYQTSFSWKKCIPFAVSLFLTTITKPSYTMVLLPLMAVLFVGQLIQSKGKSFRNAFCVCMTLIPTGLALLYQFFGVFTGTNVMGEETGIAIEFAKVWSYFSSNILLSIVMGLALPLGVLVLNWKEFIKNRIYRFAWYHYLVAMLMFLFLYEKGFRMLHANFSWGYMHGIFFVFMISLILVIKNTIEWCKSIKIIFVLAEWGVLLIHLICGVNFLWYALQGKDLAGF